MTKSAAYTGPDDWQTRDYEWFNKLADEYEMLEVDFEVKCATPVGDQLRITAIRWKHNGQTAAQVLPKEDYDRLHQWLCDTYEPTEEL